MVAAYLTKFSKLCHNMINCGPVLSWLEVTVSIITIVSVLMAD